MLDKDQCVSSCDRDVQVYVKDVYRWQPGYVNMALVNSDRMNSDLDLCRAASRVAATV